MILKKRMIAAALINDPNTSIPTPQPVQYRYMFGGYGSAIKTSYFTFTSQTTLNADLVNQLKLNKNLIAVKDTQNLRKKNIIHNEATPKMEMDPETYEVRADGQLLTYETKNVLPITQRYFLF